jgi:WD40-like Beta Propeller Repeat
MTDLDERFRSFSRTRPPDLWRDIEQREPGPLPSSSTRHRALAIVVAFALAAAGLGVAALTFGGSGSPTSTGTLSTGPKALANGPIYFRVGGADSGSRTESIEPDGTNRRVVFPEDSPVHYSRIDFSPDGTRIAFDNFLVGEYGIETADPDGSDVVRLTDGVNDSWASWSPDGNKILFSSTRYDPSIGQCMNGFPHEFDCPTDIFLMDADGSNMVRLTDDAAGEFMPVWSPDGARIAFVREADTAADPSEAIYTMAPDGTDVRQASSADGGRDFWPSWSPDGSRIAFAAIRNDDWGIWVVSVDGSDEHRVFGGEGTGYVNNPVWSPDGRLIAFVGNPNVDDYSPDDALYVMEPDGTGVTLIADAPGAGVTGDIAWQPVPATTAPIVPSPTTPPSNATVMDTFKVGEDVRSVAYGEGSVWVAVSNNDGSFGGRIIRIDPETHEVLAEIPVDAVPTWEVGGGAMVLEGGDLWVAGDLEAPGAFDDPGGGADAAVIRIDASTNDVVGVFELGGANAADLVFLEGELWVLVFGDETVDHHMEVVGVDPASGDVTTRIPLETWWAHTIVAADGRLVVLESGASATNVDGVAVSIDPVTEGVTRADIPSESFIPMPVHWQGQVWIGIDPGFARFDPVAGRLSGSAVTLDPNDVGCCLLLEADARGIWFLSPDAGSGLRLLLFDPASSDVADLATVDEGTPVAMAIAPNAVWILNYEGTLTHVELG